MEPPLKKGVFAIAGPIGSGKSTVAGMLAALTDAPVASFAGVLRDVAVSRRLSPSRIVLQELGVELVEERPVELCRLVLNQATWADRSLILDGLRHWMIAEILRSIVSPRSLWVVYVEASRERRRRRVLAEMGEDLLDVWERHPAEVHLDGVKKNSAAVITNNGSLEELRSSITSWLRS